MKKYKRSRDGGGQRNQLGGRRVVGQTSWRRWHLRKALREGGRDETCREVGEDQPAQHTRWRCWVCPKLQGAETGKRC